MFPGQVPKSSLHTVSRGGVADGFPDREPHLRRRPCGVPVHPQVDHEGRRTGASPLTHRAAEAISGGEAVSSGEQRRVPRALAVRRPGSCGPCGDGPTGWRDRHGSACAGGSRAPCDGDGCSAGTYACSRLFLRRFRGMSTPHGVGAGRSTGTARPRSRQVADRGHAAPVDGERPANGTRRANGGSNPRAACTGRPVDDILLHASTGGYVRDLRGPSRPRFDQGPARHVIRVTDHSKWSLTCGNAGRITSRCGRGGLVHGSGPAVHSLWTTLWKPHRSHRWRSPCEVGSRAAHEHDDMVEAKAVRWTTSR